MQLSRDQEFRLKAEDVLSVYEEVKYYRPNMSCESFYNNLGIEKGNSTGGRPAKIFFLPSEFIADVEITARKFLSSSEFDYFRLMFMNTNLDDAQKWQEMTCLRDKKDLVYQKLGGAFESRGLHPPEAYFKPKGIK